MKLLYDNLGLLLSFAGIIIMVGVWYWNYRKERKRISFEILTSNQLADTNLIENKISFVFEGQKLDRLRIIIIKIINDGVKPIPKDDFESPINIFLGVGADLLSTEVLNKYPSNLPVQILSGTNQISIEPLLMNKGEYFEVKLLVSGSATILPCPEARINGITNFTGAKRFNFTIKLFNVTVVFGVFGFAMIAQGSIIAVFSMFSESIKSEDAVIDFIFGGIAVVISLLTNYLENELKKFNK